jgi:hypothetical protein
LSCITNDQAHEQNRSLRDATTGSDRVRTHNVTAGHVLRSRAVRDANQKRSLVTCGDTKHSRRKNAPVLPRSSLASGQVLLLSRTIFAMVAEPMANSQRLRDLGRSFPITTDARVPTRVPPKSIANSRQRLQDDCSIFDLRQMDRVGSRRLYPLRVLAFQANDMHDPS